MKKTGLPAKLRLYAHLLFKTYETFLKDRRVPETTTGLLPAHLWRNFFSLTLKIPFRQCLYYNLVRLSLLSMYLHNFQVPRLDFRFLNNLKLWEGRGIFYSLNQDNLRPKPATQILFRNLRHGINTENTPKLKITELLEEREGERRGRMQQTVPLCCSWCPSVFQKTTQAPWNEIMLPRTSFCATNFHTLCLFVDACFHAYNLLVVQEDADGFLLQLHCRTPQTITPVSSSQTRAFPQMKREKRENLLLLSVWHAFIPFEEAAS